jgi:hypothetical protein
MGGDIYGKRLMLKLRREADDSPDHFQVYTGDVRIGTIYAPTARRGAGVPRRV